MRNDKEQSGEFVTKEESRQGGALIPIFFIMIMVDVAKEIKSKIKQRHVGYKCLEAVSIGECMFADDLVVFAKNRSELKYNLMLWNEALKKINMNINMEKTKIMIIGGEETVEMEVGSIKLEQVKSFKYLGVQIQNNGKQESEINEELAQQ